MKTNCFPCTYKILLDINYDILIWVKNKNKLRHVRYDIPTPEMG